MLLAWLGFCSAFCPALRRLPRRHHLLPPEIGSSAPFPTAMTTNLSSILPSCDMLKSSSSSLATSSYTVSSDLLCGEPSRERQDLRQGLHQLSEVQNGCAENAEMPEGTCIWENVSSTGVTLRAFDPDSLSSKRTHSSKRYDLGFVLRVTVI
jgi:hypothetical protein